jgi:RNA polymerase sigma factor (TIGR02999 family)
MITSLRPTAVLDAGPSPLPDSEGSLGQHHRAEADLEPAISSLIDATERGDDSAAAKLFSVLYAELHRLARRELRRSGGETLGATTLLHEAYLDMAGRSGASFPDRGRFMAYACRVMRGLIIDHVRQRHAARRGGLFVLTSLDDETPAPAPDEPDLERMGEALGRLERLDPQLAEVVDLKFFCGFSFAEIASMRGVSERTVQRRWDRARIYLHRALGNAPADR